MEKKYYDETGNEVDKSEIDLEKGTLIDAVDKYIYHIFTEKDFAIRRINELKTLLNNSDYKAIKYAEGILSEEEYQEVKEQRQVWRNEINELEEKING